MNIQAQSLTQDNTNIQTQSLTQDNTNRYDKKPLASTYTAPLLQSRFPYRLHPAQADLQEHSQQVYVRSLETRAKHEVVSQQGDHVACAGFYAAYCYPDGDLQRIKDICGFFLQGVLADDLLDNSTDLEYISALIGKYRAAVRGSPHTDLSLIRDFFINPQWDPAALQLLQAEMNRYLNSILALRRVKIERRSVSVDEYLQSRIINCFMGVMHLITAFTVPNLTEAFLRVSSSKPFTNVLIYSGVSIAALLDMYKLNGEHAEVCEYTNVVSIMQRASPEPVCLAEAMRRASRLFDEYEGKLAVELERLAGLSTEVAEAMGFVHGGTVEWMARMRGNRYSKGTDHDGCM